MSVQDFKITKKPASFFKRFLAINIDGTILSGLWLISTLFGIYFLSKYFMLTSSEEIMALAKQPLNNISITILIVIFAPVTLWEFYLLYTWTKTKQTFGDKLTEIYLVKKDTTDAPGQKEYFLRRLGLVFCFITFGVGFLWNIGAKNRRLLPDLISGTEYVEFEYIED